MVGGWRETQESQVAPRKFDGQWKKTGTIIKTEPDHMELCSPSLWVELTFDLGPQPVRGALLSTSEGNLNPGPLSSFPPFYVPSPLAPANQALEGTEAWSSACSWAPWRRGKGNQETVARRSSTGTCVLKGAGTGAEKHENHSQWRLYFQQVQSHE